MMWSYHMNYCETKNSLIFLKQDLIFGLSKEPASFNWKADQKILFLKYVETFAHIYAHIPIVGVYVCYIHRENEIQKREKCKKGTE